MVPNIDLSFVIFLVKYFILKFNAHIIMYTFVILLLFVRK